MAMEFNDQLGDINKRLKDLIINSKLHQNKKTILLKQKRNLDRSDFVLVNLSENIKTSNKKTRNSSENYEKLGELLIESSKQWSIPVLRCYIQADHNLGICLHRASAFHSVLQQVQCQRDLYGSQKSNNITIVLDSLDLLLTKEPTLNCLRSIFIYQHIQALLKQNGYSVLHSQNMAPFSIYTLEDVTKILSNCIHCTSQEECRQKLLSHITKSKYYSQKADSCLVNAEQYLEEEGFSKKLKNILHILVMKKDVDSKPFQSVIRLESSCSSYKKTDQLIYLFVVNEDKRHLQLESSVLWSMMTDPFLLQLILCLGPVLLDEDFTLGDYFRVKESEMKQAAAHKYNNIEGKAWMATTQRIVVADMKFDLLSTTCTSPVKLQLNKCGEIVTSVESRGGSFVLYNYARLATLFSHFKDSVSKGEYPELPTMDCIDFSLLREKEEWLLLFNYILPYPKIVKEIIGDLTSRNTFEAANLQTHKICQFVLSLSSDLSSYYSRVRILMEPRSHLIPLIHARIYLLQAVQQVLYNSLLLLDIQPLNQL